jgi:predicted RNA binding protein YcfA (HicA-like mRNA interferase family)
VKLPILSAKQVLSALNRLGFVEVHRKGSHVKMKHTDGRVIVFPFHDELDRYTLKGALRDAEVDIDEFLDVVR